MSLRSALYIGTVVHARPGGHRFSQRMAVPLLFLDELSAVEGLHPLGGHWPLRFDRRDYVAPVSEPLDQAVRRAVRSAGFGADGPVAMLGHPRTWGWCSNPVTFYFCFDAAGRQVTALAFEVTNTPWHERHTYVVGAPGEHWVDKALHVSPFLGMDARYRVRYSAPDDDLAVQIDVAGDEGIRLRTTMTLTRRPLDRSGLSTLMRRAMPLRVSTGIYLQAARLWRKGARFHRHSGVARVAVVALARAAARRHPGSLLLEDGRLTRVGSDQPPAVVRVHDQRVYPAVLRGASVGLAESYVEGWWDADDLTGVVRSALQLSTGWRRTLDRLGRSLPARALWAVRRAPSAAQDRDNIAAHYDLSNELFTLMLDPTMAYSCAVFERPGVSLEEAQLAKFDRLAAMLGVGPGDHVLEIGTGWGGLAVHLAQRYGCRVTTTTISAAQRHVATLRAKEFGVEDRVEVLGEHYRELTGSYDALVCVEMIEAVDRRHHDDFFATCGRLREPAGRMALQAITMADASFERASQHRDFVRKQIFPGGCIPSVSSIAAAAARASDLTVVRLDDIGVHYAETLRRLRTNFEAHREQLPALGFDERFARLWTMYLCYCEAAFMERHISDVQMLLVRPAWRL